MTTNPTVWVAVDRRCGHPIMACGNPADGRLSLRRMLGDYARHVEMRKAGDGDLIHLLQGARCAACALDGREVGDG